MSVSPALRPRNPGAAVATSEVQNQPALATLSSDGTLSGSTDPTIAPSDAATSATLNPPPLVAPPMAPETVVAFAAVVGVPGATGEGVVDANAKGGDAAADDDDAPLWGESMSEM